MRGALAARNNLRVKNARQPFEQLLLFIWKATLNTSQEGETRREVKPNCILPLFLGSLLEMRQSPIGQFFSLSLVTLPEVLTKCSFLFISKVTSIQVGHVAAARKLKANWFATQNRKTMVNNELPLSKRTNQERPYEQLLHFRSWHLHVGLEQFCTSLFNQHLDVLVSAPEPHLHPKLP